MKQKSFGIDEGVSVKETNLYGDNRFSIKSPNDQSSDEDLNTSQDRESKQKSSIMSKLHGLHQVPLSVKQPRRNNCVSEADAVYNLEYADSVSSTARELPDVEYIVDNFESESLGTHESESIQWGSKVVFNEDVAQESEPTPVRTNQRLNTGNRQIQKHASPELRIQNMAKHTQEG